MKNKNKLKYSLILLLGFVILALYFYSILESKYFENDASGDLLKQTEIINDVSNSTSTTGGELPPAVSGDSQNKGGELPPPEKI